MKRIHTAAANRRALAQQYHMDLPGVSTLVPASGGQAQARDVLAELRDSRKQREHDALHQKLISNPRFQEDARKWGLQPEQLWEVASVTDALTIEDTLASIRGSMDRGDSFDIALKEAFRVICGGKSKETR